MKIEEHQCKIYTHPDHELIEARVSIRLSLYFFNYIKIIFFLRYILINYSKFKFIHIQIISSSRSEIFSTFKCFIRISALKNIDNTKTPK